MNHAGNVYISEHYSQRIRRVDAAGTIDTIAGTGEPSYGGDGGPAVRARFSFPSGVAVDHAGNLYIADTGNNRIRRVDASGTITTIAGTGESLWGEEGPAVEVPLERPRSITVDSSRQPLHCCSRRLRDSPGGCHGDHELDSGIR